MSPAKSKKCVYLSGGMEYASNEGRDWRDTAHARIKRDFGWSVFNPNVESDLFFQTHFPLLDIRTLKETDTPKYKKIVERLVEIDCREIAERSDLVICFWDESAMRGAGTKGELTIAKHFGKPVYMVTSMPVQEIPGWVLACTTHIFPTFEELYGFLQTIAE